jgi:hypothetical protein
MRTLIVSLAAAGFAISLPSGYAAGESPASPSKLEQPGRTADDEPKLKSAGASSKAGRAIDEDAPLKSAGASHKAGRTIDEDAPLKSAGTSSKHGKAIDENVPLKSARAASRPGPANPRDKGGAGFRQ